MISLRVTAPSQNTLQKVVDSTKLCIDNLGTLDADFDFNAYVAMKSRRDMKCMLKSLLEFKIWIEGRNNVAPFKLLHFTHPIEVFPILSGG